jgi:hypothetical protein
MSVNFKDPETTLEINHFSVVNAFKANFPGAKVNIHIPTSEDVSGIELRMLPPFIKDNRTPAIEPFFRGYARLYCLTLVVSDVNNNLVGNIDLKGFERIGDREHLPINKSIFYWQSEKETDKAPTQIHIMCSVMKSKKDLRNTGEILSQVKGDKKYQDLISSLAQVSTSISGAGAVIDVITEIAGIVGGYLKDVEDKPLGTVINSYTTLHGDFDKPGISTQTYSTRNVDFQFQVVVRSEVQDAGVNKPADALVNNPAADGDHPLATIEEPAVDLQMMTM